MVPEGRSFPMELLEFYVHSVAFDLGIEVSQAAEATLDVLVQTTGVGRA